MKVNLYRRHKPSCLGGHPWQSRSSELEERRKSWKRCDCLIHFSATIGGKFGRKVTGTSDWDEARSVATAVAASASWEGPTVPALAKPPDAAPQARMTIADACGVFITNRESAHIAPATLRKYRTFTKQLTNYADGRGYVMLDQFTATDADRFYSGLKLAPRTKGKRLGVLRAFFRFAVNRKWMAESPVSSDIRPPVGSSKAADKSPFTDEEVERIIKACDGIHVAYKNEQGAGEWTGEDLKDLFWLMLYTGYRISDATFFDMSRLRDNQVMIRAQKNGSHVFTYVPDWLRDRLKARAKQHGDRPFVVGKSERLETVTNVWRRRLAKAFEAAGPFEEPATPHRARHTFARILLEKGVPVADVADLMGDDEKTIRQHYSRWVGSRQDRLTALLKDAFADRPKLIGIMGGKR